MDSHGHVTITLDTETGNVRVLVNELSAPMLPSSAAIHRASHVEPDALVLRLVFRVLRMFGDHSRAAAYTRTWSCMWRVNLSPVGGDILPERFRNRQFAIDAEVAWLEVNWL